MFFDESTCDGTWAARTPIGSREVGFWSILIVAIAFWANVVRATSAGDLPAANSIMMRVLDNGAFDVFAWMMVFARSGRLTEAGAASRRQIGTAFLAGAVALAPVRLAAAVALMLVAWLLLTDRRTSRAGREAALLLLALVLEMVWTSRFAIPHTIVTHVDARICAFLLGLLHMEATAHADVVANATMGFSVAIWPYCASSYPLSAVCLAFLVTLLYLGQTPRWGHGLWLGMSLITSMLLTEIRLVLLARGESDYHWWHDGPGAPVYVLAAVGLAIVFPVLAARREPTRMAASAASRGMA